MYKAETFLDVRYYETDLMGIVHHSNYVRYFECGRNDALVQIGLPISEIESNGIMLPVVSVECNYKIAAKNGERLRIETIIEEMPKVKIKAIARIYNEDNQLVCDGVVTLGFIHSSNRRATRAPQFVLDKFKPYFIEPNN